MSEFALVSPTVKPERRGGSRENSGRRIQRMTRYRDKLNLASWRAGAREHPEILAGILKRAKRLNDPAWTPNKYDAQCAIWVAEHYWPTPRSAPVQVNIDNREGIVSALESGDLTPSDAAALLRTERLLPAVSVENGNGDSVRETLAKRLEKAVEGRPQPEPVLPREMTQEEIEAMAEKILMKKLERRNV
jgi:hypothetical protein